MYLLCSGKNPKWKYYLKCLATKMVPKHFCLKRLPKIIAQAKLRNDWEVISQRIDYYNHTSTRSKLPIEAIPLKDLRATKLKEYYYDFYRTYRYFNQTLTCLFAPGDVTQSFTYPTIAKSRPIGVNGINTVLLKLNHNRHFIFVNDSTPYQQKLNKVLFRGNCFQPHRQKFMRKYFGHPLVDAAEAHKHSSQNPKEWRKPRMTIRQQLQYKFIMAIEGNDVASNLKWIMSSNSIAVMPQPKYETWFMEGTLIPNYHYIEIDDNFNNLEERINYYIEHEKEALEIIQHAHKYVDQFKDTKREQIIEIMVLDKYFNATNQTMS